MSTGDLFLGKKVPVVVRLDSVAGNPAAAAAGDDTKKRRTPAASGPPVVAKVEKK
jgi:hypothetical protein